MNTFLRSTLVGIVAGAAAAAAWAALVVQTGTLFSSLGAAIGVVVGAAMRIAARFGAKEATLTESDARMLGLVASLVTLLAILGGKVAFFAGLIEQRFGTPATWDAIREPFFTSLVGIRGLYLLIAVVTAFAIVASAATATATATAKPGSTDKANGWRRAAAVPALVLAAVLMGYSALLFGVNAAMLSGMGSADRSRALGTMTFQLALFIGGLFLVLWCLRQFRSRM